jgi:hypothetical protein
MPTIADIYSAIDSAKRKGADFVRNPGASLQQMIGYGVDRANAARDQLYQATEEEGIGYGPKTQALAKQMAEVYNPIGMTTWHGSPHIFERFDLGKLGTGEGAQAYGSGMYVAQNPSVAKDYAKVLASKSMTIDGQPIAKDINNYQVQKLVGDYGNDLPKLKTELDKYVKEFTGNPYADINSAKNISKAIDENKFNVNATGNLYKVDVPDTHIRRMLDWDAPIKEQPIVVRKLAKSLGLDMNDLGGDLLAKVGKDEAGRKIMQDAGIRGVKYLDEKSRFSPFEVEIFHKNTPYASSRYETKQQALDYAKEREAEGFTTKTRNVGTKNFVVFDPSHMKVLERNSQPIN